MLATHNYKQTWSKTVSAYIALTGFARDKFIQAGFPAEKILVKPNYLPTDPGTGEGKGNYALFVGRLTPEKGIDTLLEAWREIGNELPLQIAGDGPLAPEVEKASERNPKRDLVEVAAARRNPAEDERCVGTYLAVDLV